MGELTIYGYSDDLIELRGDISKEEPKKPVDGTTTIKGK